MRAAVTLVGGILVMVLAVTASCAALSSRGGSSRPEDAARAYFRAWSEGDFTAMRRLVDHPPAGFADRHRELSRSLHVAEVDFVPAPIVRTGATATEDYQVTRRLAGLGTWRFRAVLRLARRDGRWRVRWSPATLYPGLVEGGALTLVQTGGGPSAPVDADGKALPAGNGADAYLAELGDRFGDDGDDPVWSVELRTPGRPDKRLKTFGSDAKPLRTTLDHRLQAAADRAVGPASAALVALRPSTGAVLAISDRLPSSGGALLGLYPPGSTFKVITAAAVLGHGMTPSTPVGCPGVTVAAQRTLHNHGDFALGTVPLARAFAESCNTTFATLGVSAGAGRLAGAASEFGFGSHLDPGVSAYSGDVPEITDGNALAEASIGQGRVQATPLDMAAVAAAVDDGTYRPPRLVAASLLGHRRTRLLPAPVAAGLRSMMADVVSSGTAAHAGLPPGSHGKTGTAEYDDAGHTHAWFIGYRGDLAVAVFVPHGDDGGRVAAPLAARFLSVAAG